MFRELRTIAAALLAAALIGAGCGGGDDEEPASPLENPAVTEAAPEAEPEVAGEAETRELEPSDREQVEAAVRTYISGLNKRDPGVCAAFVPGAVTARDAPEPVAVTSEGSEAAQAERLCVGVVGAFIGKRPASEGPAWRRTEINELHSVSVGDGEARVTATVTHDYAGGDPGIGLEEDVIYLREVDGEWRLAKPSGTFYRAVGFATPPLRALTPP